MHSIGFDISKSTISIHVPLNALDLEIENTSKAIKSFYSKLKKLYQKELDSIVFVYEPTGSYSALLTKFCAQHGIKAFVINPKQSANFARALGHRSKSDRIDAQMLSKAIAVAREDEIRVPIVDNTVETIKELMSYYRFTVKQRVAMTNHHEALRHKEGNAYTLKDLTKRIKESKEKEAEILAKIKALIESDERFATAFFNIKSIPGIGDIAGIVLLHLFIKYPQANQRQIVSLTGLDPIVKESGTSVRSRAKISKAGSRIYRGNLFMATMVAIKFNDEMKDLYNRLKENGKHSTAAQIAVMRKLIIIAHSLYKNNRSYDPKIYRKACGNIQRKSQIEESVA